jgi:hypothetical protein
MRHNDNNNYDADDEMIVQQILTDSENRAKHDAMTNQNLVCDRQANHNFDGATRNTRKEWETQMNKQGSIKRKSNEEVRVRAKMCKRLDFSNM